MPAFPYADVLACVSAIYRALDAGDPQGVSRWFTSDAVWHRPDGPLTGIARIEAMVQARPPERTTAHIVANLEILPDADGAIALYYLTAYVGRDGTGGFAAVLRCEDRLVATADGLRIVEKRSAPLLRAAAA